MADALRRHMQESEVQAKRLEEILQGQGSSPSTLKDMVTGFMGNMAALAHMPAQDEILKNTFANFAFEHYEIAAYKGLLVMAEAAGDSRSRQLLNQSLSEEVRMAEWLGQNLPETVGTYIRLETQGQKSGI